MVINNVVRPLQCLVKTLHFTHYMQPLASITKIYLRKSPMLSIEHNQYSVIKQPSSKKQEGGTSPYASTSVDLINV